jgi:hypothetical protein
MRVFPAAERPPSPNSVEISGRVISKGSAPGVDGLRRHEVVVEGTLPDGRVLSQTIATSEADWELVDSGDPVTLVILETDDPAAPRILAVQAFTPSASLPGDALP